MTSYRICGLAVASDIALPGAVPAVHGQDPDVIVCRACVPRNLAGGMAVDPIGEMTAEQFLLRIPNIARFLVTSGREIAVETEPGARECDALAYILGTAFGILLHQRGALVLHASAVASAGHALAICGESAAGKSTLAAALGKAGWEFATDDLCVIGLDGNGRPEVWPDGRRLKLWSEAIDRLELSGRRRESVQEGFEKYYLDPIASASAPPALGAIYVLRDADPNREVAIEPLSLPDAMRVLECESYRPVLRARFGEAHSKLAQAAAVLNHTKIFLLTRPRGFEYMPRTLSTLRAHWESLNLGEKGAR